MKVVGRTEFGEVLTKLKSVPQLSLDCETFGLRPYQGDVIFSLILATSPQEAFYFNYQCYPGLDAREFILDRTHIEALKVLFKDPKRLWYMHNAKFDLAMLYKSWGVEVMGSIHCTQALGLVQYNEHMKYSLDASLERIGLAKDDAPKAWMEANKAFEKISIPGRVQTKKNYQFYRVPFEIITKYGLMDGTGTYALAKHQEEEIERISQETEAQGHKLPPLRRVASNEKRLTRTVFNMERNGVLIDLEYCKRAITFEDSRMKEAQNAFEQLTRVPFKDSPLVYQKAFESDKDLWVYGKPSPKLGKVSPSFDSDVLACFRNPAAQEVLKMRDAKAKSNFYSGFIYHADDHGRVHPHFNPDGTVHGRFSSSEPNFQNLKKDGEDDLTQEFVVRRAVVPGTDRLLVSFDYSVAEYRLMLDYACLGMGRVTTLGEQILSGVDFHQATADLASKVTGKTITRGQAKTSNFLNLYGGGAQKLADQLKISLQEAYDIRNAINSATPEIQMVCRQMMRTAEVRGFTRNWLGRRCYFPDSRFYYCAPNYVIAGGVADICKVAMNEIDELLHRPGVKTKMVLMVHDQLVFEMPPQEVGLIPEIKEIMEKSYPYHYIPQVVDVEFSTKSMADLEEWTGA